MDVSSTSLAAPRYRPPHSSGRRPLRPAVRTAQTATARAIVTLALGAYGLVDVVEDLPAPWAGLVETLALALLAVGFLVAARHFPDHRLGWLLSGAVAAGLAVTALSHLVGAAAAPALPLAAVLAWVAALLLVGLRAHR